ncbi:MAG: hypothetical protein ACR2QW_17210 [bacterium]
MEQILIRTYRVQYINNWAAKPRLLQRTVGKTPILAAGISNGDQQMLQYVGGNGGLAMMVHYTDAEREDSYDSQTDKLMPLVEKEHVMAIDMKSDWKTVFPQ